MVDYLGGAIHSGNNYIISNNYSLPFDIGGAIYSIASDNTYIHFEGNSSPIFSSNAAGIGGAMFSDSYIVFGGNSSAIFSNNNAIEGGVQYTLFTIAVYFLKKILLQPLATILLIMVEL